MAPSRHPAMPLYPRSCAPMHHCVQEMALGPEGWVLFDDPLPQWAVEAASDDSEWDGEEDEEEGEALGGMQHQQLR